MRLAVRHVDFAAVILQIEILVVTQRRSEETSQWWGAAGDTLFDFTGSKIEPRASSTDSDFINHVADRPDNPLIICGERFLPEGS